MALGLETAQEALRQVRAELAPRLHGALSRLWSNHVAARCVHAGVSKGVHTTPASAGGSRGAVPLRDRQRLGACSNFLFLRRRLGAARYTHHRVFLQCL